jgi:hypothetical protein
MYSKNAKTKLSLFRWAQIMGINPLHFAGVQLDGTGGSPDIQNALGCSQPWSQYSWQNADAESRDSVATAIQTAERNIEALLGYSLLPEWRVDEWRPTVRPNKPELVNLNLRNVRGYQKAVELRWGMFVTGGLRAADTIQAGAAIVYSDADGDNYDELATITQATTVTDSEEIRVYYPGHAGEEEFEIRPISVSIAGGVATITFDAWNAVLESRDESFVWETSVGTTAAQFLATADVVRVYNDPQTMATLVWQPTDWCGCDIVGSGTCVNCQYTVQTGCLVGVDLDQGVASYKPSTWDATNEEWDDVTIAVNRDPDLVRCWYRAGLQDQGRNWPTREMDPHWEKAVAYYAASLLDRGVCSCASNEVARWQEDIAFERGSDQLNSYKIAAKTMKSELGTRRGALYALDRVLEPDVRLFKNAVLV